MLGVYGQNLWRRYLYRMSRSFTLPQHLSRSLFKSEPEPGVHMIGGPPPPSWGSSSPSSLPSSGSVGSSPGGGSSEIGVADGGGRGVGVDSGPVSGGMVGLKTGSILGKGSCGNIGTGWIGGGRWVGKIFFVVKAKTCSAAPAKKTRASRWIKAMNGGEEHLLVTILKRRAADYYLAWIATLCAEPAEAARLFIPFLLPPKTGGDLIPLSTMSVA